MHAAFTSGDDEHLVRFRRAEFVAQLMDEPEQHRVFLLGDLDVHLLVHRGGA